VIPGSRGRRSSAVLVAAILAAVVGLGACSEAPSPTAGPVGTGSIVTPASGEPVASASPPASPVDGVLTGIKAQGLTQVTGFSLRLDDGQVLAFQIGVLENGDQFPPGHLAEHLATSSPIRVWFRVDAASLVVYRLEDAP
jgi:hypothetical protein